MTFQSDYISLSPQRFGFKMSFSILKSRSSAALEAAAWREILKEGRPTNSTFFSSVVFIKQNYFEADCETKKALGGSGAVMGFRGFARTRSWNVRIISEPVLAFFTDIKPF